MAKKWLDTGYLKAKPKGVNHEQGIIQGIKVCSEGPATGHGFNVDSEFITTLVEQGGNKNQGLKARFGHPNMCSTALGTFIGRFKNFSEGTTIRDDGQQAQCCFADLSLSESAKETPNGDLYSYILSMAENDSDMFGTSIVFTPGQRYRRNEKGEKVYPRDKDGRWNEEYDRAGTPDFVECEKLHACDCVDDPAANDGLFSSFANETVAGQITEFLDLNPQVFQLIENNPGVMEAIAQYGDKFDEFLKRYREYRETLTINREVEIMDPKLKDKNKNGDVTLKELEAAYPEIIKEARAEVTIDDFADQVKEKEQAAAAAEHDRIMAIYNEAHGEESAAKFAAIVKPGATMADMMAFANDKAKAEMLAKMQAESPESMGAGDGDEIETASNLEGEEKWKDEYSKSKDLQNEFSSVDVYVAFMNANDKGLAKIIKKD